MYQVSVEERFRASHHLKGREDRHEHEWRVRIIVAADRLDRFGISVDFKILHRYLSRVVGRLAGKDLNQFVEPPSCENLARFIFGELKKKLPHLISIEVWEGDYGSVRFSPGDQRSPSPP
ncbi:6-carboxytetrahydropterin synthase QueD [candidate division WOR-3 bacterium]|uniref:6-carboxy-5,6,7,8-tetrahydropterin synthase n=1 Tax=candidate division WOR-3 bacterium TaxID=2052148 RepID=A0A660SHX1_UNCW3|nr:MAG: 6-carboxytetrahydropterin synthase QueD [candidate division WOR-3 bacterium]